MVLVGFKPDLWRPTSFLQCFDTVGLVIWPVKIVPEMTYYVSSGALNPTHSLTHSCPYFLACGREVRHVTRIDVTSQCKHEVQWQQSSGQMYPSLRALSFISSEIGRTLMTLGRQSWNHRGCTNAWRCVCQGATIAVIAMYIGVPSFIIFNVIYRISSNISHVSNTSRVSNTSGGPSVRGNTVFACDCVRYSKVRWQLRKYTWILLLL